MSISQKPQSNYDSATKERLSRKNSKRQGGYVKNGSDPSQQTRLDREAALLKSRPAGPKLGDVLDPNLVSALHKISSSRQHGNG